MMSKSRHTTWIAAAAMLAGAAGCAHEVEPPEGEPVARKACAVTYSTGDSLNALGFLQHVLGRGLNGIDLNGRIMEGAHVAHVSLGSATYDGEPMHDVVLFESKFRGRTSRGKLLFNRRFENVSFDAVTDTGQVVELVVRNARRYPKVGMHDTFLYVVEYRTADGWLPLCGWDEAGESAEAIALRGKWDYREGVPGGGSKIMDPDAFTFACLGHVAAKCVEMGYKPWREAIVCHVGEGCEKRDVGHLHQACTRMMRADYCGDGTAHTQDGLPVNVYDGYGIRYDSEAWDFEAEWTADGASCMRRERLAGTDLACAASLQDATCGDPVHFVEGTSLMSEIPPGE